MSSDSKQDQHKASLPSVRELLSKSAVERLLKEKKIKQIVEIEHTQTVGYALEMLAQYNILSAPVSLATSLEDLDETGMYVGLLDVSAVLHFFIRDVYRPRKQNAQVHGAHDAHKKLSEDPFWQRKVIAIAGDGDVAFMHRAVGDMALLHLVENGFFRKSNTAKGEATDHVHRTAVFDPSGRVVGIVSQSDIIKFIVAHKSQLGSDVRRTIKELGLASYPLVSIPPNTSALEGFNRMYEAGKSAVAVVNQRGELVGNLSASDLRGLTLEEIDALGLPVLDFINRRIKDGSSHLSITGNSGLTPAFVGSDTPLIQLMEIIADSGFHRIYVADKDDKPAGVVTLTDVLRLLL